MSDTSHDRLHSQGGAPLEVRDAAAAAHAKVTAAAPFAAHVLIESHGVIPVGVVEQPPIVEQPVYQQPTNNVALEAPAAQTEEDMARALVREAIGG